MVNSLHGRFAGADMRKQLDSMRQAAMERAMDRDYDLARGHLGHEADTYGFEKDKGDTAETLGWVNIGLSGLEGYAEMMNKRKEAKQKISLASLYKK